VRRQREVVGGDSGALDRDDWGPAASRPLYFGDGQISATRDQRGGALLAAVVEVAGLPGPVIISGGTPAGLHRETKSPFAIIRRGILSS
jgi:hypothetical protein